MAKAIYGHFVHPSATLAWENERLRARVAALEAELQRLTLELESYRATAEALYELREDPADHLRPALA